MSSSLLERAGAAQADARAKRDQTAIRRIGLVVNDGKREALEAAGIVRAWACEHGVPCTDLDAWEDLGGSAEMTDRQIAASAGDADLIVTIGGPIAGARPCGLLARPWIGEPAQPRRSQWGCAWLR